MGEGIDRRTGFDKDKQRILENFRTQADGPPPKRQPHLLLNDQDHRFLQIVQHPHAPQTMSQAEQDFMNVIYTSAKY
jgi:hypothetical protein